MKPDIRVIILAARGVKTLPGKRHSRFATSLEWILHAYRANGVTDISVIGGKEIETLGHKHPHVTFYYDPDWQKAGMLQSLFLAQEKMDGDCIISYADIVYRPELIVTLIKKHRGPLTVVTDTAWKTRYPNRNVKLMHEKAEKIWLNSNGNVKKIRKHVKNIDTVNGEYAGICYLSKAGAQKFTKLYDAISSRSGTFHESKNVEQAYLTDLFQEWLKKGQKISALCTEGEWAELDEPQDFGRFIFGTKAQTLERLKPVLKNGIILPHYTFTTKEWGQNKQGILKKIRSSFREDTLVVRSSSLSEDTLSNSYAGKFTSVLGVPRKDVVALRTAIEGVIASFGECAKDGDQILIQPQVKNVALSGVLFTCDLKTGAPYYVINADTSGSTDSVTAGKDGNHQLHYIYKSAPLPKDKHLRKIVACARELEKLTGSETLDIEFAFDKRGKLFIFQTRPITSNTTLSRYYKSDTENLITQAKNTITLRLKRKPHLSGRTTILGDMPDWNPAELIGAHPKPLARSLFEELISKEAWRIARKILGYRNPAPERLMVTISGHPYVDVRCSLNSFSPANLPEPIREKLVNESLHYLRTHPDSHDKFEFEVATTCYTPLTPKRIHRWKRAGMTPSEISTLKRIFKNHTERIVCGKYYTIAELIGMVESLDERRKNILSHRKQYSTSDTVKFLIDDCEELGTVPFSSLARMAFMGSAFLRSFVEEGAISQDSYNGFLNSIDTVATEIGHALVKVNSGQMPLQNFFKIYGHLRPGTYEIESYRYDEKPDLYFDKKHKQSKTQTRNSRFSWAPGEKTAMQTLLKKSGMSLSINKVLKFTKESICGREMAKFLYSRNISDALRIITKWGDVHGLNRANLSFLTLHELLYLMELPEKGDVNQQAVELTARAREQYEKQQQVLMPSLIFQPEDIEHIQAMSTRPNFITTRNISGNTVLLSATGKKRSIQNKIVMIESADPGFDWIFTNDIKGLITKYGGAASHMAIRCAEFDLPAAIGVGSLFDELKENSAITIDCGNQTIQ